jgi:hypothetical protein
MRTCVSISQGGSRILPEHLIPKITFDQRPDVRATSFRNGGVDGTTEYGSITECRHIIYLVKQTLDTNCCDDLHSSDVLTGTMSSLAAEVGRLLRCGLSNAVIRHKRDEKCYLFQCTDTPNRAWRNVP